MIPHPLSALCMWAGSSACTLIPFNCRSGVDHGSGEHPNPGGTACLCTGNPSGHLPLLHVHIYLQKREQNHPGEASGYCPLCYCLSQPPLTCRGAAGISQTVCSRKLRSSIFFCCWADFFCFGFFCVGLVVLFKMLI